MLIVNEQQAPTELITEAEPRRAGGDVQQVERRQHDRIASIEEELRQVRLRLDDFASHGWRERSNCGRRQICGR